MVLLTAILTYACPTPFVVFWCFFSGLALPLLCRVWSLPGRESLGECVDRLFFPQRTMDTVDHDHVHRFFLFHHTSRHINTWNKIHSTLVRKEVPVCQRVNIFFSLCDIIGFSPLMLLHWEMDSFPSLIAEGWLETAVKESFCLAGLTLTCFLCNTKRGRSPTWHQISIENQDRHAFGSWEVSAATSLSSKSSVSGILKGTNVEKLWGSFIPRTWTLSWKISLSNLLHALISSVLLFVQECYINARENSMCSVVTEELQKSELCYQELDNLPQTQEKTKLLLTVACI